MERSTQRTRPSPKVALLAGLAALALCAACVPFAPPGSAPASGYTPPPGCSPSSSATTTDAPLDPASAAAEAAAVYQAEAASPVDAVPLVTVETTPEGPRIESHAVDSATEAAAVAATEAAGGDLVSIEPDERVTTSASNDPLRSFQWPLNRTTYEAAWALSSGGGVTVAVVDSGVDGNHPDLSGRLLTGWTFLQGGAISQAGAVDGNGHGTHVAGTIAAKAGNALGITGAAPGVKILPVRVLGSDGSGYYSDVAQGIKWAAQQGARVVNLSLGGSAPSAAMQSAIDFARGCKAVVVAAAGNEGSCSGTPNAASYPAAIPGALGVGAVDSGLRRACFSNVGSYVDFAAPGVGVWSTTRGGTYAAWQGTSMATPHVSAAAAIVLARRPSCSAPGVASRLRAGASRLPLPVTHAGVGLVDPLRALQVAGC